MKVVTAQEMQQLDRRAIEDCGIPGVILMENAGLGVLREMTRRYGDLTGKMVTVVAGKGNNGGDGFVVARHLYQKGIRVKVYLTGQKDSVKGDAKVNLQIYTKIGGELQELEGSKITGRDLETLRSVLNQSHVIVDAIFGTGLTSTRSDPSGLIISQIINLMNESGRPIVAVDIPSGICADTGEILGTAVMADLTVTFGLPKRGHYLYPGAAYRGVLRVVDIGIPKSLVTESSCSVHLLTSSEIKKEMPVRPADAHKGNFGHVLVIGGSVGKTGASAMAAQAALRVGAGLVTLAIPSSLNPIMEQKLTEVMTAPLPETPVQTLSLTAEKDLLDLAQDKSVVILGPGLSTHPETQELVRKLLDSLRLPIVLDADGINALGGHMQQFAQTNTQIVLTPHPGEMGRLLGVTSQKVQGNRLETARAFAQQHHVWLILKGAHTIIADPVGNLFINPTGNEGMATAGTGDVLAGMLGGFISQGLDPLQASKVGVYLHGLAGDLAAGQKGTRSMIAGDLIECIPLAIQKIVDGSTNPDPYDPFVP
jgi:NAD(P)H-hydrate epimerase